MTDRSLQKAESLRNQFIEQVAALPDRTQLHAIEVMVITPEGRRYAFDVRSAATMLTQELFWDERGDWSDAEILEVRTI